MAVFILCFAKATCAGQALGTDPALAVTTPTATVVVPETTLQTVTVTGQGQVAEPFSVLEGSSWQWRRSATLGDSLGAELGVQTTHFGAGASRPIIRGMDGARVAVLSGGMPVQDASSLSPDHAVAVDTALAEGVEIWRGPAALVHGGAVGGAVNVRDAKIPTALPQQAVQGTLDTQWGSNAREKTAALGLTTGAGPLALRVEAAGRQAGDYRAGRGWQHAAGGRHVQGSYSDGQTGTLGLSWVGANGYLGAAYTDHRTDYGLPGHQHSDCHPHGSQLHCAGHGADHGHAHDHDHDDDHAEEVPQVDMRSRRWDVRGEWRTPGTHVQAVRLQGSHTRYAHDELEDGVPATSFHNRAHDVRLEVEHAPVAGWHGLLGISQGQRYLRTDGAQAYVQPTTTQKLGLFMLEHYRAGAWQWQAALRHDRQTVSAHDTAQTRQHHGTSASLGTVWKLAPGWQAHATWSHAQRMPSAEELFANGLHAATHSWEVGNDQLHRETTRGWELGLRQSRGGTSWSVSTYRHQVQGYIYGQTVDQDHGFALRHTTQAPARFTGGEAQLHQRLNRWLGVGVFGDVVRARLADGSHLPRTPAARLGLRMDASWHGWEAMAEWVQVAHQRRTAAYETATPGYGMLNLAAHYQFPNSDWQLTLKADNLTDRLGYAHTSAIKQAAPLKGRNITLGMRVHF